MGDGEDNIMKAASEMAANNDMNFAASFVARGGQPEFKYPESPRSGGVFASVPYVCMHCRLDARGSFAPRSPFCECTNYHWVPLDKFELCPNCNKWWMQCGCPLPIATT